MARKKASARASAKESPAQPAQDTAPQTPDSSSAPAPVASAPAAQTLSWGKALFWGLIGGVVLPLAYPKFDIFPLAFLALVPFLYIAEEAPKGRAFVAGLLGGFLTNYIGYNFLTITLERFGGFSSSLALLGAVLLSLYQGFRTAFFVLFVGIGRRKNWPLWLVAPAVLVALELLMPFLFTFHLGNALYLFPSYIQIADVFGVYGVSAFVLLANVLIYELIKTFLLKKAPFNVRLVGGLAALQVAVLVYGLVRISLVEGMMEEAPTRKVGIIQPNFDIDVKGKQEFASEQLARQIEMSREVAEKGADLIVWPETSYPYPLRHDATMIPPRAKVHDGFTVPVLLGAVTIDAKNKVSGRRQSIYNTAFMVTPDGVIQGRYDKNFLVWFSESLPFSETFPILEEWFPNGSNFQRGTEATLVPFEEFQIAPDVCNDDIMPAYTLRLRGKPANLLVNITNDAWFGNTAEPYFHLALSTFRAVENHLYLVRATNTGISALVDPVGRIVEQTPVTLDTDITPREVWEVGMMPPQETPYRLWGNSFAYLCVALSFLSLLVRRKGQAA